jgi:hypothetical protein
MNRNSRRRAKAELKLRRQAGGKLVNPKVNGALRGFPAFLFPE